MKIRVLAVIATLLSPPLWAETSGSDKLSTACATVEFMAKMVAVNLLLPKTPQVAADRRKRVDRRLNRQEGDRPYRG